MPCCSSICAKTNKKYLIDSDKNKKPSYFNYWDINDLCGRAMSKKLSVGSFKWLKIHLNLVKIL